MLRRPLQLAILAASVLATGYLLADDDEYHAASKLQPVTNQKWQTECSSCHTLYHPGLLPERSWRRLMGGLNQHFGENASLDQPTQAEILKFLVANSADHSQSRRSARIAASIPANNAPLRITETPYFIRQHDEISPAVWKRQKVGSASNCVACHAGAEKGDFSEDRVSIPR
jgi:cytochrome c553